MDKAVKKMMMRVQFITCSGLLACEGSFKIQTIPQTMTYYGFKKKTKQTKESPQPPPKKYPLTLLHNSCIFYSVLFLFSVLITLSSHHSALCLISCFLLCSKFPEKATVHLSVSP